MADVVLPRGPKLIEVALPLQAINEASVRDINVKMGHPSNLHRWWARRPLPAARAVLWVSLVDDPLADPDRFPTEEDRTLERKRLFSILERLLTRENSNNPQVLDEARREIEPSINGGGVRVLDPFCGRGIIPLEAQRLGLPSFGGDLNPVAVLISKAMVEIPPRFKNYPPVNPASKDVTTLKTWNRAQGLAEDIKFYGDLIHRGAQEHIGYIYPRVEDSTVIAWIWARSVKSPDPSWSGHIPLVSNWILRKKEGKPLIWVEPIVDRSTHTVRYNIREGGTPIKRTIARGGGICIATGASVSSKYIQYQSQQGLMSETMIAVAVEGESGRMYFNPTVLPNLPEPNFIPKGNLLGKATDSVSLYGMTKWSDLFTTRQLISLGTLSTLLLEVWNTIKSDSEQAGLANDGIRLRDGGAGSVAYADAVVTYLSFAFDKLAEANNSLVRWRPSSECPVGLFGRQAIPMIWDYAEANPLSNSSGSWKGMVDGVLLSFSSKDWPLIQDTVLSDIKQRESKTRLEEIVSPIICTDPPYYDNIQYADISDFFYVWLRHNLFDLWPDECSTLLTPKLDELVASPWRVGSMTIAQKNFEEGMKNVMKGIALAQNRKFPATIFYAFKQQEKKNGKITSTGWETFLQGLVDAGLQITATWPIHTETTGRMISQGTAALASSVVLVCRPRSDNAQLETRGGFIAALRDEMPEAIELLQEQAIPPVDMAQSAIGPGMRIFSRYARVVEADGSTMSVRTALGLINEKLEEILSAEESELDSDSRFALTWYRQYGFELGSFGDAEVLAKAMGVAVEGVEDAGVVESKGGKVRLLRRDELDPEWDPRTDRRLTVWEITQHLIARMEKSEGKAGELLAKVGGGMSDQARHLAYLLYQVADSEGATEDAVAYNSLVTAWESISQEARRAQGPTQTAIPT